MNPKDPQGMLKALHGSHGTQVSCLLCLRVLFQLFLMYSGAQTAQLTWPKWNHTILSSLPMERQQQILPGKSWLPSLMRSPTLQALQIFMLSTAILVLFLCHWYMVNCTDTALNSWQCTFNKSKANCSLWCAVVLVVCMMQPATPSEESAAIMSTVKPQASVGTWQIKHSAHCSMNKIYKDTVTCAVNRFSVNWI